MASCTKCGQSHMKRRNGRVRCQRCGPSDDTRTPYIQVHMREGVPPTTTASLFVVPTMEMNDG